MTSSCGKEMRASQAKGERKALHCSGLKMLCCLQNAAVQELNARCIKQVAPQFTELEDEIYVLVSKLPLVLSLETVAWVLTFVWRVRGSMDVMA